MTIVDRQHAAQIVTNKGKVFNYDAIECMLNDLDSKDEQKIALILVNDYDAPGQLTDARDASYLISKAIPSPMGAFLTGFSIKKKAINAQDENSGELYTWEELKERFNY